MTKHDDEEDVFRKRAPKPADDLGPLFGVILEEAAEVPEAVWMESVEADVRATLESGFPGEENDCGLCGKVFTKDEPRWVLESSIGAAHPDCARNIGYPEPADDDAEARAMIERKARALGVALDAMDILLGDPDSTETFGESVEYREPEPPPPHKPEPPTKAERAAAIERIKSEVVAPLIARALARVGLPLPAAGVTADDVWEIAQGIPSAALLGTAPKAWSWLGPWLTSLAREGRLSPFYVETVRVSRRSTARGESHGNAQLVYLHPTDPRAVGGPRSKLKDA